jgi:hypothetical protein
MGASLNALSRRLTREPPGQRHFGAAAVAVRSCRTLPRSATVNGMSVFARHVDAAVVALSWTRTVVIEQGRWHSRRTAWKPHADNVRNLRAVHKTEPEIVVEGTLRRAGASMPKGKSHEVMAEHTYFEYEEFQWHKYRSFSARGDSTAGVHWPEHTLEPDQRVSERRETYHAKFSVTADGGEREYLTELDQATWRTLKVGKKCRLAVGAFSDEVKQVTPVSGRNRRH